MRDASDPEIFRAARDAGVVVMTKDRDFMHLLDEQGPPSRLIWLRVGNCNNAALQTVLAKPFQRAMELLRQVAPASTPPTIY